ncbi:hypothetical protein CJ030_MR3G006630 [Morella rubra]|uniref:Uncharacterized protein n=1 Tax=Morella rubra TaxID=262757 RepID=A0A6A1WBF9_9ROSI|nr:hypothetical protein CJ030_MR3G006630 [Morella rubra]
MQHKMLLPFWWIMHLILCSAINPKKHTIELSYHQAKFMYLVVVWEEPVDLALYIYQTVRAKALKIDVQISLSYGIFLTQFLHAMLVLKVAGEPKAIPFGPINKIQTMHNENWARWNDSYYANSIQLWVLCVWVVYTRTTSCQQGGKRLWCDSSVRAESTPSKLAVLDPLLRDRHELLSPTTVGPVGTQTSYACGDDMASSMLSSHIGLLVLQHVSFEASKWKEGPDGVKSYDDFQLDYDQAEDRIPVTSMMNTAYRTHKNRMFQHYFVFNSKEEVLEHLYLEMNKEEWTHVLTIVNVQCRRSAINKENRAKLKIVHTSGARSFQRMKALLKNPKSGEISPALLYKKMNTNKDGMWTLEDARENFIGGGQIGDRVEEG